MFSFEQTVPRIKRKVLRIRNIKHRIINLHSTRRKERKKRKLLVPSVKLSAVILKGRIKLREEFFSLGVGDDDDDDDAYTDARALGQKEVVKPAATR